MIRYLKSIPTRYSLSLPRLTLLIFLSLISLSSFAQKPKIDDLTDDQIKEFMQKAQASGMNESQIEKAALMQGYSPADVAKMRDRLSKLASDNADLKRIAGEKVIQSKVAEHDMTNDLEFLKQIETENKVVSVKREYQTGSGKMELNIKGGDKKFLIPVLIVFGLIVIAILLAIFH